MLRTVAPTAYTTFYVGVLANADALKEDVSEGIFLIWQNFLNHYI